MTASPTGGPIIGIDLGTTNSLVSVLQAGVPIVISNALGEFLTPSAVSVDVDGLVLVGAAARARATTDPLHTALSFKRDMGTDRTFHLRNRAFRAPELSALVLAALKADAEAFLGQPVEEAVVTVPAYFNDLQRQATRDAGAIAGLRVERIINEPTAAALAYGLHGRDRELKAIVLDLGGGTFDVTVLEIMEGVVEIHASAGDARLGGDDFVDALLRPVAQLAGEGLAEAIEASPFARARLREACLGAVHRLSAALETTVVAPGLPIGATPFDLEVSLSREQAEYQWRGLLGRIRAITLRALRDAGIGSDGIDEVLLVGGATRMPCVTRLVAQVFGRMPLRALQPDEAVAKGAAVQAGLKSGDSAVDDMVVTDVAPFTLGVETVDQVGGRWVEGVFTPVLERGTVIPASRVIQLGTVTNRQNQMRIAVYQGERAQAAENRKLGEFAVRGIPSAPAGTELVRLRFSYDINGVLEVEATVVSTGRMAELVIESGSGRLTPAEVAASRKRLEGLKVDLRETLPNRVALERAEALHVELTGEDRAALNREITAFRAALAGQVPDEVDAAREQLIAAVAWFARGPSPGG